VRKSPNIAFGFGCRHTSERIHQWYYNWPTNLNAIRFERRIDYNIVLYFLAVTITYPLCQNRGVKQKAKKSPRSLGLVGFEGSNIAFDLIFVIYYIFRNLTASENYKTITKMQGIGKYQWL
jgi:hypothetical protein